MSSIAVIRAQVESRLPGALTAYQRPAPEVFPSGIAELDHQIGGIPQSAMTQIYAPENISSGKTTLLVSLLAQLTRREQFCALVDTSDCFDPASGREPPGKIVECRPSPQLVLRRFRPLMAARIETRDGVPAAVIFKGRRAKVVHACGPWRGSGDWWDPAGHWRRDEWDVDLNLNGASGLYLIFRDQGSGQWFVEGMYD